MDADDRDVERRRVVTLDVLKEVLGLEIERDAAHREVIVWDYRLMGKLEVY